MPVEMIGWIAPRVSSELIAPSGPPFDAGVIAETARIHERAGFDRVLIGYFSVRRTGFWSARMPRRSPSGWVFCWRIDRGSWRRRSPPASSRPSTS